jgi:hypothetical protein
VASTRPQAAPRLIVTVVRHGGLCATGSECRSVLRISDSTISGQGYVSRRLSRSARGALLRAIAKLDAASLRAHPFTGTCPTAYDGAESIYRFRGFALALPSCCLCRTRPRGTSAENGSGRRARSLRRRETTRFGLGAVRLVWNEAKDRCPELLRRPLGGFEPERPA